MRSASRVVLLSLAVCCLSFGQRKEYIELQREVANFEDQVRAMQRSIEEKLAQLAQQIQQQGGALSKTNAAVAAFDKRLDDQSRTVSVPLADMGAKVNQMATEFQALKESVSALNVRFGKLEQQMLDVSTAVKTLQAPPAPPSPTGSSSGLPAEVLFQNAVRDKDGGNLDLALKEFTEYLQNYSATYQAPSAQYYIGDIYYRRGELEDAVKAFDAVVEKFPDNEMTPDAHYMKGMALEKLGQPSKARSEFLTLLKRFPNSEAAARAKVELRKFKPPTRPKPN